jgi:hypothetical protein
LPPRAKCYGSATIRHAQKFNNNIPDDEQEQKHHQLLPPRQGWLKCNVWMRDFTMTEEL